MSNVSNSNFIHRRVTANVRQGAGTPFKEVTAQQEFKVPSQESVDLSTLGPGQAVSIPAPEAQAHGKPDDERVVFQNDGLIEELPESGSLRLSSPGGESTEFSGHIRTSEKSITIFAGAFQQEIFSDGRQLIHYSESQQGSGWEVNMQFAADGTSIRAESESFRSYGASSDMPEEFVPELRNGAIIAQTPKGDVAIKPAVPLNWVIAK